MKKEREQNNDIVERHKKKIRIISLICILGLMVLATVLSIPLVKELSSQDGMDALKNRLDSYNGVIGVIIFTLIQALQVVIAVIPPVQIVGGMLFGWFWGGVLSFIGTMLGTVIIFLLVKKFGRPIVEAFVDEKAMKKFKFLQDAKKLTLILIILYFIPGIPKDVLSYIVPLTPMSKKDFFRYVMPFRLPAILMSTILGSSAINGSKGILIAVLIIAVVLGILGLAFKDKIVDKMRNHRKEKSS